ncbi:MAG: hypothetical protein QOH21_1755, partial [Acidobacteriota bacterium]|nr:hypothetical protein [Acidobacteriota bacterium]
IFLTGYDVQAINLQDVLVRGVIAPPNGTTNTVRPGIRSLPNNANPNFLPAATQQCNGNSIPRIIPASLLNDVMRALTIRPNAQCQYPAGAPASSMATGYVTIDLVATCTLENPLSPAYWDTLLYDNVLTGDWELVAPNPATGNYAEGNPMVHIRAIPEGGNAGSSLESPLPFTFYDRLLPAGKKRTDRRQPLPSTFTARFIEGGTGSFDTDLLIWREGAAGADRGCDLTGNDLPIAELVRFDERENATVRIGTDGTLGVASSVRTATTFFPPATEDVAGWLYVNLNNGGAASYSANSRYDLVSDSSTVRGFRQSQGWVTTRMAAEGRYGVAFDAASLGNGCTPSPASPELRSVGATLHPIGPAPDRTTDVLPAGNVTHRNDDSCDIALLPAATLLLPYFQVDVTEGRNEAMTTLVTVVNTSNQPQIARMTIWTDFGYPVLTFDVFLTGYDVQAVNLYDVLVDGRLPGSGSQSSPRGARSTGDNPHFLPSAQTSCTTLPSSIPAALLADVRATLQVGHNTACGQKRLGGTHEAALGYVTVDVVATCGARSPRDPESAGELLFDNVLTGDYQLVDPHPGTGNFAYGSPLVHIRAIPEGGNAGAIVPTKLTRTFYQRLSNGVDRRQPLPSTFAARYIQGGGTSFQTSFAVWREAGTQPHAGCTGYLDNAGMTYVEAVRFDERENPTTNVPDITIGFPIPEPTLPASSLITSSYNELPPLESGDVAGWMYLNLATTIEGDSSAAPLPNQAWVVTTMSAEGRYGVAFDAMALGNGCSPPRLSSDSFAQPIRP